MKFWWKNNSNCRSVLSEKKNLFYTYIVLKPYNFDIKSVTKIWPLFMHEWQLSFMERPTLFSVLYRISYASLKLYQHLKLLELWFILTNILNHSLKHTGIRLFIPDNTKNSRLCKTNILQYTKMKCSSTL